MANSFKSDDSFLRKLVVGAAGTNETINSLKAMGFNPIELERGSKGFKIWKKIKIKRERVPDILCLNTGLRFESRGKKKTEISMSHSQVSNERAWDYGMREDDYVSITVFQQNEDSPVDLKQISPVHFVRVKEMQKAYKDKQTSITKPKGAEEGSEVRVVWPCAIANQKSIVSEIGREKIVLTYGKPEKRQTIYLIRKKKGGNTTLIPQVRRGDAVEANQVVAAIIPVFTKLICPPPVDEGHFVAKLDSKSLSERYAAAKALRYRGYTNAVNPVLKENMNDTEENIYVQLEAAAALAAHGTEEGWIFMMNKLLLNPPTENFAEVPLTTQLETIIVASEIPDPRSEMMLISVLQDSNRNEELRAGAAWALGQFVSATSATALVDIFNSNTLEIKIEAARALLRIAEPQVPHLVNLFKTCDPAKRDGVSWALARTGNFNPADILAGSDEDIKKWASYIVGYGKDKFDKANIDAICNTDPQVYFAASVLWQIMASWIHDLKEY